MSKQILYHRAVLFDPQPEPVESLTYPDEEQKGQQKEDIETFVDETTSCNSISLLISLILVLGLIGLISEAYAIDHDVMWNNIVIGEVSFEQVVECMYFKGRTFNLKTSDALQYSIRENLMRDSHLDHVFLFSISVFIVSTAIYLYLYLKSVEFRSSSSWMIAWFITCGFFNIINGSLLFTVIQTTYVEQYNQAIHQIFEYEGRFYNITINKDTGEEMINPFISSTSEITLTRAQRIHHQAHSIRKVLAICGSISPTSAKHFPDMKPKNSPPVAIAINGELCLSLELQEIGFCQHTTSKAIAASIAVVMGGLCFIICIVACCKSENEPSEDMRRDNGLPENQVIGSNQELRLITSPHEKKSRDLNFCNKPNHKRYTIPGYPGQYQGIAYQDDPYDPQYPPVFPSIDNLSLRTGELKTFSEYNRDNYKDFLT